jgi:hypothetical protein
MVIQKKEWRLGLIGYILRKSSSPFFPKYSHWIAALQLLMCTPAFFAGTVVSLRVELVQLPDQAGQGQLAIAMLGAFFHGG